MADENSFVQEIKFKVDDSDLRAAIERMRAAFGDGATGGKNPTDNLEKGIKKAGNEARKTASETAKIGKASKDAAKETDRLSKSFGGLAGAIKGAVAAYIGFQGISKVVGFGQGSIAAFNVQNRAEKMLEFGMRQNGTAGRAQELKDYASAIQGRTMYGDEAMLTAAGAWQNKIRDVDNSKRMMELVADFAARSTGGGTVDAGQMRGFAQQLMQSLSGRAITLKAQGFDISAIEELQKIRQKGGTVTEDMEIAALERVLAPIKGLSSELAKTDEGKIQQLKNTIGDMREEIGRELLPVVANLADNIKKNLPTLKGLFESLGNVFKSLVNAITDNMGVFKNMADWISALLNFIGEHLTEIVAFGAGMKVLGTALPLVSGGVSGLSVALKGLIVGNPLGAVAAGIAAVVGATLAANRILTKRREDSRFAAAEDAVSEVSRWANYKAKAGAEDYAQDKFDSARKELQAKIVDYAKMHGGAVPQEWLDALSMGRNGAKYNINEFGFRQGNKYTHIYGTGSTGKVIDPRTGKEFDPDAYTYDPNALAKQMKSDTKGDTNITNIQYTNNIETNSDLMAKAIKENLKMLLTSNLSMITRSEGAKALAL